MDYSIPPFFPPELVVERELKSSERGCVYLVRNLTEHKRYIYRVFSGNPDVYRKLQGVVCPYLPQILDVQEAENKAYVLEEYIQGDNLAFLLELHPLEPTFAKQIILHLCEALKILHGIGAVHRDIKPENIILRGSDAVLIDFDASRICKENSTTDTQIMGTTGYAAPEQYGFSQTDARTDIYALGILLNEILTNRHPSLELTQGEFRPVVEKCIQVNADQRYSSVTEVMAAINFPRRRSMQRRGKVFITGFLVFGVLLFIVFAVNRRYQPDTELAATETNPYQTTEVSEAATTGESLLYASDGSTSVAAVPGLKVFAREQIPVSDDLWDKSIEGYATPFTCDMDGDGISEKYLFGIDFINSPHEAVVYYDRNISDASYMSRRDVHPCVWRIKKDGTMDVAPEFADLIQNVDFQLWRVDNADCKPPETWTTEYSWPGCVQITYSSEQEGTWLYWISADIAGYQLTAQATSTFLFE